MKNRHKLSLIVVDGIPGSGKSFAVDKALGILLDPAKRTLSHIKHPSPATRDIIMKSGSTGLGNDAFKSMLEDIKAGGYFHVRLVHAVSEMLKHGKPATVIVERYMLSTIVSMLMAMARGTANCLPSIKHVVSAYAEPLLYASGIVPIDALFVNLSVPADVCAESIIKRDREASRYHLDASRMADAMKAADAAAWLWQSDLTAELNSESVVSDSQIVAIHTTCTRENIVDYIADFVAQSEAGNG